MHKSNVVILKFLLTKNVSTPVLYRNVKGDMTVLFLRIESKFCNQIIRSCLGWFCASYFLCSRKNPCVNGNDALFHAGFGLQASERNIKGLKF